MSETPSAARASFGDIAPALATYTDEVLFGDVWERPGLSPRDGSLVTITCLIALYRINELPFHLRRALDNGVTRDEIIETITHLAFYSGWPTGQYRPSDRPACVRRDSRRSGPMNSRYTLLDLSVVGVG